MFTSRPHKLSPLNRRIAAAQKSSELPFQVDESRATQINIYILDKVASLATEDILKSIDEPAHIRSLIKQLLLDNVIAIKE